jgi:hypothetical protein
MKYEPQDTWQYHIYTRGGGQVVGAHCPADSYVADN